MCGEHHSELHNASDTPFMFRSQRENANLGFALKSRVFWVNLVFTFYHSLLAENAEVHAAALSHKIQVRDERGVFATSHFPSDGLEEGDTDKKHSIYTLPAMISNSLIPDARLLKRGEVVQKSLKYVRKLVIHRVTQILILLVSTIFALRSYVREQICREDRPFPMKRLSITWRSVACV